MASAPWVLRMRFIRGDLQTTHRLAKIANSMMYLIYVMFWHVDPRGSASAQHQVQYMRIHLQRNLAGCQALCPDVPASDPAPSRRLATSQVRL